MGLPGGGCPGTSGLRPRKRAPGQGEKKLHAAARTLLKRPTGAGLPMVKIDEGLRLPGSRRPRARPGSTVRGAPPADRSTTSCFAPEWDERLPELPPASAADEISDRALLDHLKQQGDQRWRSYPAAPAGPKLERFPAAAKGWNGAVVLVVPALGSTTTSTVTLDDSVAPVRVQLPDARRARDSPARATSSWVRQPIEEHGHSCFPGATADTVFHTYSM